MQSLMIFFFISSKMYFLQNTNSIVHGRQSQVFNSLTNAFALHRFSDVNCVNKTRASRFVLFTTQEKLLLHGAKN